MCSNSYSGNLRLETTTTGIITHTRDQRIWHFQWLFLPVHRGDQSPEIRAGNRSSELGIDTSRGGSSSLSRSATTGNTASHIISFKTSLRERLPANESVDGSLRLPKRSLLLSDFHYRAGNTTIKGLEGNVFVGRASYVLQSS